MKLCSSKGKGDKTGKCGSYHHCTNCQYRVFFILHMIEEYGNDLVLAKEEQDWLDNVYSKLDADDKRYVMGKYSPETPTPHRPKKTVDFGDNTKSTTEPTPAEKETSKQTTSPVRYPLRVDENGDYIL